MDLKRTAQVMDTFDVVAPEPRDFAPTRMGHEDYLAAWREYQRKLRRHFRTYDAEVER